MGEHFVIGSLTGTMKWHSGNDIIVDVDGIGYILEISDLFTCPDIGEEISLFVYTYVREDKIELYGFENMAERKLFTTLLSVSRIGPKAGMNILSSLSYEKFINAILSENLAVLKEISGIGPKTAQRLVLELQNKMDKLAQKSDVSSTTQIRNEELYEALNNLGYSNKEIDKAVSNVEIKEESQLEDKIKKILSFMGKESF